MYKPDPGCGMVGVLIFHFRVMTVCTVQSVQYSFHFPLIIWPRPNFQPKPEKPTLIYLYLYPAIKRAFFCPSTWLICFFAFHFTPSFPAQILASLLFHFCHLSLPENLVCMTMAYWVIYPLLLEFYFSYLTVSLVTELPSLDHFFVVLSLRVVW